MQDVIQLGTTYVSPHEKNHWRKSTLPCRSTLFLNCSLGIAAYTITPQINSCIGNPIIVPIQVNPTPEVFGPSSTTICSGESPKISLIPVIIGTSFTWTHLSNKVTGASDGNGDEINQILT